MDSAVQLRSIYIAIKHKTQGNICHNTIIKIHMYQYSYRNVVAIRLLSPPLNEMMKTTSILFYISDIMKTASFFH